MINRFFSRPLLRTIIISSICVCILVIFLFALYPYIFHNYRFLIGFDAGAYQFEANRYLNSSSKLIDTILIWDEPGLFVITSYLSNVLGVSIRDTFIVLILLSLLLLSFFTFIFMRYLSESNVVALLSSFLVLTSSVQLGGLYKFFLKQIFAFLLFIIFILFLNKSFKEKNRLSLFILLTILSSFILFTHRAISLLWILVILFHLALFIFKKNASKVKFILGFSILAVFLIFPYVYLTFNLQVKILYEYIINSLHSFFYSEGLRDVVGDSLVRSSGVDNPLVNYFISGSAYFVFGLLGLINIIADKKHEKFYSMVFIMLLLSLIAGLKFGFGARFILNLDLFLIFFAGLYFSKSLFNKPSTFTILSVFFLISLSITSMVLFSSVKAPYLTRNLEGIEFIRQNILKENALIFAPDYLQTILAQEGYLVPLNYGRLNKAVGVGEENVLDLQESDDFLLYGYENLSLLTKFHLENFHVYVIFGNWDIGKPLPRASSQETLDLKKWDNSRLFKTLYRGSNEIYRIYELK